MTDQKLDENGHLNLNDEAIALINNFLDDQVDNSALLARSNFWKKFLDSRRDYDDECGYPKTNEITPEHYQTLYDREAIATRVVELMPAECWSSAPMVYETEKQTETEFETAWNALATKLNPSNRSWLDAKDSHPVWHYLHRVDVLSGISRFGIVLLGINDGLDLREPVRGLEEQGSIPSKEVDREQKKAKLFPSDSEDAVSLNVVTNRHEGFTTDNRKHEEYQLTINQEKTAKNDLLYLRTFPESLVDIVQYETNEDSPRYGQPVMYSVTFNDPLAPAMGIGQPLSTQYVHWTRVIHVCDNLESSELFGVPRQRPVYNNLLNLHKVYGGSAEMYWQGAFPGLSFETQPQQGRDATIDKAAMRGQITNYFNSLQRYLLLRGMTAKTISPQVVDPTSQIEVQIDAICIRLGVPKRIFMGSERGELASGQDAKTWNRRVMYRQDRYITPRIIAPFVDRLIMIGVLPEPKQYVVEWPDLNTLTDQDKADLAVKYTDALVKYVGGGVDNLVEPTSYLVHLLGLDPEQVEDILQATLKHLDEAKGKSSEEGEEPTGNVFCPTGKGGGVDPTCSPKQPSTTKGSYSDSGGTSREGKPDRDDVLNIVADVRNRWGYQGNISLQDGTGGEFEKGGVKWNKAGECSLADGSVTIYRDTDWDSVEAVERLTAHEFMHGTYEVVHKKFLEEQSAIASRKDFEEVIRADGSLRNEFTSRYPTYGRMHGWIERNSDQLIKDDGVSEYSKAYWKDFKDGKASLHIAVHETLAEMAGIHESQGVISGSKSFKDFYKATRDEYKVLTNQKSKRKGPGLVGNQLSSSPVYLDSDFNPTDASESTWLSYWEGGVKVWAHRSNENTVVQTDNEDHGQDEYGSWTTDHDYVMDTGDFLVNSEGKSEKLNQPFRTPDGPKKFGVYAKNDKGNVVLVRFGDPDMEIKRDDPERRKSFRARHGCDTDPGPKWKPKYWSCKMWESGKTVSDVTNHLGGFPVVNHPAKGHNQKTYGKGRSVKSQRAKEAHVLVGAEIQRYSEEHNEPILANALGGVSLDDNEPVDVVTELDGKKHGVELKTMTVGANRKITMKRDAIERKKKWERKHKGKVHTVVFDDTEVFNANGKGSHDESKRRIFYRRGGGSFRVDGMLETTLDQLPTLMTARINQIPKSAGGTKKGS